MMTRKYSTIKDMPNYYPFFTPSAIRHLIYENKNGIKNCMIKIGGKILFDLERFDQWIEKHRMSD